MVCAWKEGGRWFEDTVKVRMMIKFVQHSSDSDSEERTSVHDGLQDSLREWANEYGIKRRALTALLKTLRTQGGLHQLPEDGRTLMQTPRKNLDEFPICALAPGMYCHFGLAVGLQRSLSHVEKLPAVIPLLFNIDGLPLSKSSNMQLWPIQCLPRGCGNVPPFVVGAFAGQSKPSSCNDFLRPFVRELQTLLVQGVNINGDTVQVRMAYVIAEFVEDKQVEVVPVTWVEGDKCAWLDNLKGNRVTSLVKKSVPPDTFWKCYSVAVKWVFATYEQARAKLNDSQYTSDLGTGSEMSQGKRTRRPPAQRSDSDKPDTPPPPKKAKQSSSKQLPAPPSNFPLVQQDSCEESADM
nr:uncharacterized protein LOC126535639 [Dermacentor andersoni]